MIENENNIKIATKIFGSGVIKNVVTNLMSILSRTFFIYFLNKDLLGINSAVNSIINILSLAELGVGTSFIYILYGAINRSDHEEINSIMRYFKKIYLFIGILILLLGGILLPFINNLITAPHAIRKYILPCYIIYVVQTSISYLFSAYKRCLLMADKQENVVNNILTIFNIVTSCLQMGIIYFTRNFILYLCCGLVSIIIQNIIISYITQKKYRFLCVKNANQVSSSIKKILKESVFSIVIIKLGQAFYKASDNLVISKILGVGMLTLYDNYNLILYSLQQFLSMAVTSFTSIIGNVAVNESKEHLYDKYKKLEFVAVFLFSIFAVCYVNCIQPFINLWIGKEYLLGDGFAIVFALRFFVIGLNITLIVYKDAMGLFKYGRFLSPLTGVMNVFLSVLFVYKMGVTGIVLASLLCDLFIYYLVHPKTVIKIGLGMSLKEYYKNYITYWNLMIAALGISFIICRMITIHVYLIQFLVNGVISVLCVCSIFWVIKRNSQEWKCVKILIKKQLKRGR